MALNEDNLDELRNAAFDYIMEHGLPDEPEARDWIMSLRDEDTTPEEAFAPLFDAYFEGSGGFSVDQWMDWTQLIDNLTIRQDEDGLWFNFDFDFESDDGEYSGSRGASGHI